MPFDPSKLEHPVVKPWDRGSAVAELQSLLFAHGYDIRIDGDYGWITEVAVNQFQGNHGLRIDGVVRADTWHLLKTQVKAGTRRIKRGDSGQDVYELQGLLLVNGFNAPRNGIFCDRTEAAVLEFQKQYHLLADGVVDEISWTILTGGKKLPDKKKRLSWLFGKSRL